MEFKEVQMPKKFEKTDWEKMSDESLSKMIDTWREEALEKRRQNEEMLGESLSDFNRGN